MLDAERLNLLALHVLELLELVTLHLLLIKNMLDLTNLLLKCLNIGFFGHKSLSQVINGLFVELERVILREQLVVDCVYLVLGAHLLGLYLLVVFLQFTYHTAQLVVLHAQDCDLFFIIN